MARFFGKIGYGETVDKGQGVHKLEITEIEYSGDVIRAARRYDTVEKVNDDLTVSGNAISVVADAYANEHLFAIRYVEWAGKLWKVRELEVQPPRLILRLGGAYNGPTPDVSSGA